jgi:PAS domain S-box-containing protein
MSPNRNAPLSDPEHATAQALLQEFGVHPIEPEPRNEELRSVQDDLAAARDRYVDLFDFAPLGCLVLDDEGFVVECNLTAATQLEAARTAVVGRRFLQFVAPEESDRWQRLMGLARRRGGTRSLELALCRKGGTRFEAQLDCARIASAAGDGRLRVAMIDVSERIRADTNLRIAASGNDAREAERRRLAYTLHEDLGQRLSAMKMMVAGLRSCRDPAAVDAFVQTMSRALDESFALVLRLSSDLHPMLLHHLGLHAALDALARVWMARLNVRVSVRHEAHPPPPTSDAIAMTLYRLAELGLAALAPDARRAITMELLHRPHDVILELQADRAATDVIASERTHVDGEPMLALTDYVQLAGGRLEVSEPGAGFRRLTILLPRPPSS